MAGSLCLLWAIMFRKGIYIERIFEYLLNFSLYTKRRCTQIQHRPWRLVPSLTARGQQRRAHLRGLRERPERAMPSRDHELGGLRAVFTARFFQIHILIACGNGGLSFEDSALIRLVYAYVFVYICIFSWNYPKHNLSWNQMGSLYI